MENEGNARCVADTITTGRPGFWPVALKIVEAYPDNQRVLGALAGGVEQMGMVITGPWSSHERKCLEEVNGVLADQTTPAACRPWLEQIKRGLQKKFEFSLAQETDEEVNQYLRVSDDQAPPERIYKAEFGVASDTTAIGKSRLPSAVDFALQILESARHSCR